MLGQQQAILVEDIYSRGLIEMQNEKRWRQEGLVFRRRLGERIFKMCVDRPLIFGDGWRGGGHSPEHEVCSTNFTYMGWGQFKPCEILAAVRRKCCVPGYKPLTGTIPYA